MYCSCTFLKKFLFNYLRMDQRDRRATEKQQRFQFKVNCLFSCNKTHMSQVGLCVLCRWSCTKHVRGNHPSFRMKVSCVCTKLTWSKCVQMCMWVCLYGSCSGRIHSKHLLKTLPRWTHMYAWECVWVYELYVKVWKRHKCDHSRAMLLVTSTCTPVTYCADKCHSTDFSSHPPNIYLFIDNLKKV